MNTFNLVEKVFSIDSHRVLTLGVREFRNSIGIKDLFFTIFFPILTPLLVFPIILGMQRTESRKILILSELQFENHAKVLASVLKAEAMPLGAEDLVHFDPTIKLVQEEELADLRLTYKDEVNDGKLLGAIEITTNKNGSLFGTIQIYPELSQGTHKLVAERVSAAKLSMEIMGLDLQHELHESEIYDKKAVNEALLAKVSTSHVLTSLVAMLIGFVLNISLTLNSAKLLSGLNKERKEGNLEMLLSVFSAPELLLGKLAASFLFGIAKLAVYTLIIFLPLYLLGLIPIWNLISLCACVQFGGLFYDGLFLLIGVIAKDESRARTLASILNSSFLFTFMAFLYVMQSPGGLISQLLCLTPITSPICLPGYLVVSEKVDWLFVGICLVVLIVSSGLASMFSILFADNERFLTPSIEKLKKKTVVAAPQ